MMFRIGQKVCCVVEFEGVTSYDNGLSWSKSNGWTPLKNEIYTINRIIKNGYLILRENPERLESGFDPNKFRPLKLDYHFVDEVISKLKPKKQTA